MMSSGKLETCGLPVHSDHELGTRRLMAHLDHDLEPVDPRIEPELGTTKLLDHLGQDFFLAG